MNFEQVQQEITRLIGLKLKSVRAGADIILEGMDESRILVRSTTGRVRSRPMSELEKIWDALCTQPAVHVDSILGGSSSSRNQPETIMANLPFVEYVYIAAKKHLVLTEASHTYGTIKNVSPIRSVEIAEKLNQFNSKSIEAALVIIVTKSLAETVSSIEEIIGSKAELVDTGIYLTESRTQKIYLIALSILPSGFKVGTYVVTKGMFPASGAVKVEMLGKTLYAYTQSSLNLLIDVG